MYTYNIISYFSKKNLTFIFFLNENQLEKNKIILLAISLTEQNRKILLEKKRNSYWKSKSAINQFCWLSST